jgi:PAS domain S-box-containing protein
MRQAAGFAFPALHSPVQAAMKKQTTETLARLARHNELEIYRRIFYASPDYIAFSRLSDGVFIDVNPGFERLLGFKREDVIGRTSFEVGIWPEGGAQARRAYAAKLRRDGTVRDYPGQLRTASGMVIDVEASASIVDLDGEQVLIAIVRDVTERKRAAEVLREADRRKDEFLAMLAHELRNPIAPISAAAELLKRSPGSQDRVLQIGQLIARQVGHMASLVDDLLDVSRVTRGLITLDRQACNLHELLSEAIEQARSLLAARRHMLTMQLAGGSAWIGADRSRMVQIIVNLLNNAAKYTPEGGSIEVRMALLDKDVELSVADNGIGIAPQLLPHVFELFTQAERTPDRAQGGLGLGLALVKNLVELHGGSVSAASAGLGQGSRFTVRLPLLSEAALQPKGAAAAAADEALEALDVMVVDDNTDAADSLALLLESLGCQVSVRYDAHGALSALASGLPQVCILDIGLPEIDGYSLARHVRSLQRGVDCLLVALSGYGQASDRSKAQDAGFDHYFVKPVDAAKLASLLAASARRSGLGLARSA